MTEKHREIEPFPVGTCWPMLAHVGTTPVNCMMILAGMPSPMYDQDVQTISNIQYLRVLECRKGYIKLRARRDLGKPIGGKRPEFICRSNADGDSDFLRSIFSLDK